MSKETKRGNLPAISADGGGAAFSDGKKTSTQATEKRRPAALAEGGADAKHKMFPKQNADVAQPGQTGHRSDQDGPGKQFNDGGESRMMGFNGAQPAAPGHTARVKAADAAGKIDAPADVGDDHYNGPGKGKTKVEPNVAHSLGSATNYDMSPASDERASTRRNVLGFEKSKR